ncbi:MAG: hypothetical protein ACREJP_09160 [Candidatus Methylomirabilales bacterium]
MKLVKKTISVEIETWAGTEDPEKGIFEGGVPDPERLDELAIETSEDEVFDLQLDEFVPTGKVQLHLRGSARAYFALARYLLALCQLETQDPDYHAHFEIPSPDGKPLIHLIVHAPKKGAPR